MLGFYNNTSEGFMLQGNFFKVANFDLLNPIFLRSLLICAHALWFLIKYSKPHQFSFVSKVMDDLARFKNMKIYKFSLKET